MEMLSERFPKHQLVGWNKEAQVTAPTAKIKKRKRPEGIKYEDKIQGD